MLFTPRYNQMRRQTGLRSSDKCAALIFAHRWGPTGAPDANRREEFQTGMCVRVLGRMPGTNTTREQPLRRQTATIRDRREPAGARDRGWHAGTIKVRV